MGTETDLGKLLLHIEAQRDLAHHARQLARDLAHNVSAGESLRAYAAEIDAEIAKLEAQIAVRNQAANESAQLARPGQSLAAPKADDDAEPET